MLRKIQIMKFTLTAFIAVTIVNFGCQQKNTSDAQANPEQKTEAPVDDSAIIPEQSTPDEKKGSIKAKALGTLGGADIKVSYYSPAVRGRIIWGGLVPYNQVWVTGAHSATSIEFTKDFEIDGKIISAGKYALFTIPGKDEWTVILNKNWRQHLADQYDEKQDVIRVTVKPEVEEKLQERLRYVIGQNSDNEGEVVVYWEKLEISLPFKVK